MVELTFAFKLLQITPSWAVWHFGVKDLNKGLPLLNCRKNLGTVRWNSMRTKHKVLYF